ncbi:BAR adaptor protein Hob3 [Entomophthora muscae]|uniref:BAR adaptor protein Hob3 n=2 Tax=Entomophthora muscae TaxID=34485 RepID=A0ACC2RU86_9FUNG|nr:BAR adaptor protein Hob3 [Entomophthora muscae]KAJ9053616.1 BAR adaptor protein Hob3 [Entomophthora muscae]
MSWSGFKKSMNRAGTSLMQKTGQVEKTIDKQFEEEERRFRRFESNLEKLHMESRGYLDSVIALTNSQQRIAEVVGKILNDETSVSNPASERYRQIAIELDTQVRPELDHNLKATVLDPVGRVIAHFPLINETIKRRNNKLLDYDAARTKAHKLGTKVDDHQKLIKAEAAALEAQEIYESVNSQLIAEIPRLVDSRLQLLDPSFEALIKAQLQFATRASDSYHSMQAHFPIDIRDGEDLDFQVESVMHKMRDLTICGLV